MKSENKPLQFYLYLQNFIAIPIFLIETVL